MSKLEILDSSAITSSPVMIIPSAGISYPLFIIIISPTTTSS